MEEGVEKSFDSGMEAGAEKSFDSDREEGVEKSFDSGMETGAEKNIDQDIEKDVGKGMEESERKDEKERAGVALEQAGQARCGLHDLLALSFSLQEKDWKLYSALPLAFLGDAVFSLMVRSILVQRQNMQVNKLHRISCALVSAPVQARMGKAIYLYLTEQEKAIFRRGRNAKPEHGAKNASRKDYLEATALETLFGFLYLEHDEERIVQLFVTGLKETGYVI